MNGIAGRRRTLAKSLLSVGLLALGSMESAAQEYQLEPCWTANMQAVDLAKPRSAMFDRAAAPLEWLQEDVELALHRAPAHVENCAQSTPWVIGQREIGDPSPWPYVGVGALAGALIMLPGGIDAYNDNIDCFVFCELAIMAPVALGALGGAFGGIVVFQIVHGR